jgi:hypothetical protein
MSDILNGGSYTNKLRQVHLVRQNIGDCIRALMIQCAGNSEICTFLPSTHAAVGRR